MSIVANGPIEGMRAWAERACRWWVGELRSVHADAAHYLRSIAGNTITIEAGERQWQVRRGPRPLGSIDCRAIGQAALREMIGPGRPPRAVIVEIPPERVLSKIIVLPAAADGRLDRILAFEISRHFPFSAERVFFGYRRIVPRAGTAVPGSASLSVEVAAVPREIVFAIADQLAAVGMQAGAFALMTAPNATPLVLAGEPLIPTATVVLPSRHLIAAVALSAVAALISWPVAQQVRLAMIDRQIAMLKPAAEAALHARTQRQHRADQETEIAQLRSGRPLLVEVLDLLTRAVPDGAWLVSLSVAGRDLVLDGLAPSAATIALTLQRNANFSEISFRSPIARDAATGLERFQLGAILAGAKR